jgi:TPR repeat protein
LQNPTIRSFLHLLFENRADSSYVLWEAQYDLGSRYAEGHGVVQNDAEAVLWYLRAAEQGLAEAQYSLYK